MFPSSNSIMYAKGQLISKCPFGVIVLIKIPTIFLKDFCPSLKKLFKTHFFFLFDYVFKNYLNKSRVSNIESDNSQNVGLDDYNNISDRIFPYFTTPSINITLL
jgi:hypothetical protein